ncbi:MAG: ATP-dependent zinc metalloprotease FtsH [Clostridia bacterium]
MSKKNNIIKWVTIAVAVALLCVVIWLLLGNTGGPKEKPYGGQDSVISLLEEGKVAAIYFSDNYTAYVLVKNSTKTTVDKFFKNPTKLADYYIMLPSRISLTDKIDEIAAAHKGDETWTTPQWKYNNPNSGSWTSWIFPALSLIAMGVLLFFMFRSGGANKQAMNFSKTKARVNLNVGVKFADVAGADEEKDELQEIVDFLKNPAKFTHLGARIPKGVLLIGPPGTGKTLFAKAVAGESGVPFFSISGSDFVEMFVGTGAARVRDLFEQAKKNMPCIIFIDEIDAVGRLRGAGIGDGHNEREQTLNQLLVQMDGFDKNDGIIIMAATNRADILDPALMRPGRFDRQIYVNVPDVKGREAIFKVHSRNKPLAPDVTFKVLARMTTGFSGADIENLLNEAAILAARENRNVIVMEDILEAINKVIAGPQKKSRLITESDKRITSYHEAGHAIIAKVLPYCDEVQEVSIIPRGMAAGYTLTRPETDDSHVTKNKLLDMITMMLGGRAAEEIVIHDISTGASNDIERASSIAKSMVTEWGMSPAIGTIFLGGGQEVFLGKDYGAQHSYSEQLGGVIDNEIKAILDTCYARALEIIKAHRAVLDNMVKVLYEKETIYTNEVEMLFEGKTSQEIIQSIDERMDKKNSYRTEIPATDGATNTTNGVASGIAIVPEPKKETVAKADNANEIFANADNAQETVAKADDSQNAVAKADNAKDKVAKADKPTKQPKAPKPVEEKPADEQKDSDKK